MAKKGTQLVASGWDDFAEVMAEVGLNTVQQRQYPAPFGREQIAEAALEWFQLNGFPYRKLTLHECMQEINMLATMDNESLRGTTLGYAVADTYHPHRFHAHATGKISPVAAFKDERRLRRAIKIELGLPVAERDEAEALEAESDEQVQGSGRIGHTMFSALSIVLGTQACANFRPGYAAHLYRRYCPPGGLVLDTSTGYGGRLVGAIASGVVDHYVGIDPNVPTCIANQRIVHDLAPKSSFATLLCLPAEDVWDAMQATRSKDYYAYWWEGKVDFAFTSPPYFAKERYSTDPTQSWVRYGDDKTGHTWRDRFLFPMMLLQYAALKPGSTSVVNIADVNLNNQRYPLKEWCINMAQEAGFVYLNTESFRLNQRVGANQEEGVAEEPVLIFRKPE